MLKIKKSKDRGYAKINWLESHHSFSFANYYNPQEMNYSHLRVINEDVIESKSGFGFHPHKDMEIITFMLSGSIEHKDSMGNVGRLDAGNAQLMRAGTGIVHSEMNNSSDKAHLLQIWINSDEKNLKPGWWEKEFNNSNSNNPQVIVEPIHKQESLWALNSSIEGKGLEMSRRGYILKINRDTRLNFDDFGTSEVYLHQALGTSSIEYESFKNSIEAGDAAMGEMNRPLVINNTSQDCVLLAFVFPKF